MKTNLNFYYIKEEYIEYLRKFDKRIPTKNRPYLGIVLKNKNYSYLAPLYSAKKKHKDYYMNGTFFRIYDYDNKYIGLIRFSNMIPVQLKFIQKIDYNISSRLYQEYYYIHKHQYQIKKKAYNTYINCNVYNKICINFKEIEKSSLKFK